MKNLYILLSCDYATEEELRETEIGSVILKVDGQKVHLDTGSKVEVVNNQISVNVIGFEETKIDNWRDLNYIDVEGEVWVESEVEFEASLVVVGESTQVFNLKIS